MILYAYQSYEWLLDAIAYHMDINIYIYILYSFVRNKNYPKFVCKFIPEMEKTFSTYLRKYNGIAGHIFCCGSTC